MFVSFCLAFFFPSVHSFCSISCINCAWVITHHGVSISVIFHLIDSYLICLFEYENARNNQNIYILRMSDQVKCFVPTEKNCRKKTTADIELLSYASSLMLPLIIFIFIEQSKSEWVSERHTTNKQSRNKLSNSLAIDTNLYSMWCDLTVTAVIKLEERRISLISKRPNFNIFYFTYRSFYSTGSRL